MSYVGIDDQTEKSIYNGQGRVRDDAKKETQRTRCIAKDN